MYRTCCSVQTGEPCERKCQQLHQLLSQGQTQQSCDDHTQAAANHPHKSPKNQWLLGGRERGKAGRAARAPALMILVLSQYVFRKFSLFQLPHLQPFANCHVFLCSADDWPFKRHQRGWSRRSAVRVMSHMEGVEGVAAAKERKIRKTSIGKGLSRMHWHIGSVLDVVSHR